MHAFISWWRHLHAQGQIYLTFFSFFFPQIKVNKSVLMEGPHKDSKTEPNNQPEEQKFLPVEVSDHKFENFIIHRWKFPHNVLQHLQSFNMVHYFCKHGSTLRKSDS